MLARERGISTRPGEGWTGWTELRCAGRVAEPGDIRPFRLMAVWRLAHTAAHDSQFVDIDM
jgi:hypothetical protein